MKSNCAKSMCASRSRRGSKACTSFGGSKNGGTRPATVSRASRPCEWRGSRRVAIPQNQHALTRQVPVTQEAAGESHEKSKAVLGDDNRRTPRCAQGV